MIGKVVELDLLKKRIKEEVLNNSRCVVKFDTYMLNYWDKLHKNKNKFKKQNKFENLRYYYLHINREITKLEIPYVNMVYYKNLNENVLPKNKLYRLIDAVSYEELYFYYFFETIEHIYNIINKLLVLINEAFELNQNNKDNNQFEKELLNSLKKSKLYEKNEIRKLVSYLANYKNSIFERCKTNYRNLYVHDFTNDIPKYKIENGELIFGESLKISGTYKNISDLLCELKNLINLINSSIEVMNEFNEGDENV